MSYQHSPMMPAEDAATVAWNEYAEAAQAAQAVWADPATTIGERSAAHQRAITAHELFKSAFLAPTPPNLTHDRNRLACEGAMLVIALAAFIGLFLPDLEATFWPLALTFAAVSLLGAWLHRFTSRLAAHLGRRL